MSQRGPDVFTPRLRRLPALALLVLTVLAVTWSDGSLAFATDPETPGKPAGLRIATEQGSLDVALDWEDVDGALRYHVRWREAGPGNELNEGVETTASEADISAAGYGQWVARVQACNEAGCGEPLSRKFLVAPAPAPAPAPTVTFVAVSSVPGGDSTYGLGETIRVTLTFSESVTVTGTPRLAIDMDPADWGRKWVAYESGSGTSGLTFAHTVVQPNFSSGGIAVLADSLELNGGAIRSASSQADAALGHAALDHDADHRVDWQLSPPQPNRAPVVNTATRNHERFVAEQNAPRGFLVSKSFAGLFSDPDGDQLTYAVAITGGRAQLAEDVTIGSWGRSDVIAAKSPHPREATMRVFLEVDADDDWDALEPPLRRGRGIAAGKAVGYTRNRMYVLVQEAISAGYIRQRPAATFWGDFGKSFALM
ncbi:MAG: hypothetical protein OXH07_14130 [Chloroflexi bacterium]|nr:hypothetical protein [Chloroflexota bacterium]